MTRDNIIDFEERAREKALEEVRRAIISAAARDEEERILGTSWEVASYLLFHHQVFGTFGRAI